MFLKAPVKAAARAFCEHIPAAEAQPFDAPVTAQADKADRLARDLCSIFNCPWQEQAPDSVTHSSENEASGRDASIDSDLQLIQTRLKTLTYICVLLPLLLLVPLVAALLVHKQTTAKPAQPSSSCCLRSSMWQPQCWRTTEWWQAACLYPSS